MGRQENRQVLALTRARVLAGASMYLCGEKCYGTTGQQNPKRIWQYERAESIDQEKGHVVGGSRTEKYTQY